LIVVGVVLGLFSVGYLATGRHLPYVGAFYAYCAHGLGRWVGVGVAWRALSADSSRAVVVEGDIREPDEILGHASVGLRDKAFQHATDRRPSRSAAPSVLTGQAHLRSPLTALPSAHLLAFRTASLAATLAAILATCRKKSPDPAIVINSDLSA
jgi:hypothetical protein